MVETETVGTRERILGIARELFADQGYGSTSISQIAERLGTSKAALYYHFKSKEEILDALLEDPVAALHSLIETSCESPGKRAEEVLGAMIDFVAGPCSCLSSFENDPSVLHQWAQRHNLKDGEQKLIAGLVGAKPSPAKVIRARAALAVAKQGTMAAMEINNGELTKAARAEILAAAVRALG
jgi:AcrR family transcriptional regulator